MLFIKWPEILKKIKDWTPLAFILATAFSLRFYFLLHRGTFWFDEVYSATYSVLPWKEFIKYAVIETNPPLYTFLLRFWIDLVGQNDNLIRLLSLFFGLATVCFLYLWSQKLFNRQVAFISSLILSIAGLHIYLSAENRVYCLLIFLSLISFGLFFKIINEDKIDKKTWIFYFLINLLLIYGHLTALLIPFIQLLVAFFFINKEKSKKLFEINLINGLFWLIWAIPAFLQKIQSGTGTGWFFLKHNFNFFSSVKTLLVGIDNEKNILNFLLFLFLSGITVTFIIFKIKKSTIKKNTAILITLLLWSLLPPIFASLLNNPTSKFFAYSLPAFCLMFGLIYDSLTEKKEKIIFVLLLLSVFLPGTFGTVNTAMVDENQVVKFLENNNKTEGLIITDPFSEEITLKRYYNGKMPIVGAYLNQDNYPLIERVARFNWQTTDTDKNELKKWIDKITEDKKIVYCVTYKFQSILTDTFMENGWKITNTAKINTLMQQYIFEFSKNEN